MKNTTKTSKLMENKPLQLFAISNSLQRYIFVFTVLIGLIFGLISQTVFAQYEPPANVRRGIANGASYSASDIETINLTNGNLMLNIPLAELPKGRGGVGQALSLMYNSKLYETGTNELMDISNQISLQTHLMPNPDGGWHYVNPQSYSLQVTSRLNKEPFAPCAGPYEYGKNAFVWKVEITFPDGSRKLFRPTGYSDYYADDYYNITPNGYEYNSSAVSNGLGGWSCSLSDTSVTTSAMTYYSTDGSYMKLVIDHDNTSGNKTGADNSWTLYMPDGGKITGGTGISTRIYDRNGNYVEGLADNVGRNIRITAGSNADEDLVKVKGFNNEELVCTIKWKNIYVQREYETQAVTNDNSRGNPSEQVYQGEYRVIDEIILPSQMGGQSYQFEYYGSDTVLGTGQTSSGWGELKSITLPSGAEVEYEYKYSIFAPERLKDVLATSVKKKTLTYDAEYDGATTAVSEVWNYSIGKGGSTVTSPDGNVTTQDHGDVSYEHQYTGLVFSIENTNGTKVEKLWNFNGTPNPGSRQINPFVKAEFTSIKDSSNNYSLTAIKEFSYDKNGNVTQTKEYDFVAYSSIPRNSGGRVTGLPSGITPVRIAENTYHNSTPDSSDSTTNSSNSYWNSASPNLRNAVAVTEIKDGSNNVVSRSEFTYDNASTTGNLTQVKTWDSSKGSYSNPLTGGNSISVSNQYDSYGNLTQTTDAKGVVSTLTYGSITTPSGTVSDLYPTQSITAYGTAQARTTNIEYDFTSGAVKQVTDADNSVSTATEYDALARSTKVKAAVGTANEIWTQTVYDDVNRRVFSKADLEVKGDAKKVAIQHFDQLGRVRLARTLEDASTEDATDEADGIKVQTRYKYDNPTTPGSSNGTYSLTSNPYRAATSAAATSEEGMGWTLGYKDKTGKTSTLKTYGGAALPAPFVSSGANTNLTGTVTTEVDTNTMKVTDQAGKLRRSVTNALGQLIRVDEPDDSGNLGTVSSPNQATIYTYDALNNLITVTQGGQTRTFSYNSLSRLTQAVNPESGTISYSYDNNGNLTSKTDARSVVTSYTYDNLNRLLTRSYSDSTPTVSYTYDDSGITYAKGRLTKVSSSVSETKYNSFDNLGRILTSQQITDGQTYNFAYSYNLSGALVEETYPSGRKVKNSFQIDGALGKVETKESAGSYATRADNFTYTAAGGVSSMQLGNAKWENTVFNSRLQPTQLGLGTSSTNQSLWKVNYDYGTNDNNGNVKSQTITVPTITAIVQNYTYDSLNRIKSAEETVSSSTIWKQTFDYDRFGNRRFDTTGSNTTTIPGGCSTAQCNPTIDTANNRFTTGQGYTYDSSGNLLTDAEGRTFTYDAENKQKTVANSGGTIGTYSYDGDGKRVKKVSATETTLFVYDASAKMVAEYLLTEATPASPVTSYLTNDTLGSPRVITDSSGTVISRRDFMPFGEEISAIGGRTSGLGYQSDDVRQKFTSYERDNETELDFAQARMYSSKLGRFSACDPIFIGKNHIANPQRWNLYVYVLNNPLAKFDPDGKKPKQKIIDVYIVFGGGATVSDLEKKEYLESLEKSIKSGIKDKNVKVTVRGWEQSTADNVAQSLRTKGASVIIAAHIGGVNAEKGGLNEVGKPRTGANAVALKDGLIKGGGIETYSQDGKPYLVKESIKADSLYLFSCQIHPDTATQIAKRMGSGGSLTYLDAGRDGETEIMSDVKSAFITAVNEGNNESRNVINASIKAIFDADKGKGVNKGDEKPITCDNKGVCKSY